MLVHRVQAVGRRLHWSTHRTVSHVLKSSLLISLQTTYWPERIGAHLLSELVALSICAVAVTVKGNTWDAERDKVLWTHPVTGWNIGIEWMLEGDSSLAGQGKKWPAYLPSPWQRASSHPHPQRFCWYVWDPTHQLRPCSDIGDTCRGRQPPSSRARKASRPMLPSAVGLCCTAGFRCAV